MHQPDSRIQKKYDAKSLRTNTYDHFSYHTCRMCVCMYLNIFKHILLRHHWANQNPISYGVSMG